MKPHHSDDRTRDGIARATKFSATIFLGRGQFDTRFAGTIERAIEMGTELEAAHADSHRKAMVYAITPEGREYMVPRALYPQPGTDRTEAMNVRSLECATPKGDKRGLSELAAQLDKPQSAVMQEAQASPPAAPKAEPVVSEPPTPEPNQRPAKAAGDMPDLPTELDRRGKPGEANTTRSETMKTNLKTTASRAPLVAARKANVALRKVTADLAKAKGDVSTERRKPPEAAKAARSTARPAIAKAAATSGTIRPGTKLAMLVDALKSKKGATSAELKKLLGWETCSHGYIRTVAARAGLKLKEKEEGDAIRFHGA